MKYILYFLAFLYISTGAIIGIRIVKPLQFKKWLGKVIIMFVAIVGYSVFWIPLLIADAVLNNINRE
ncbi:hypothetical protein [Clostridium magnum]|uniref:hypothetical protein n=1 Tax=Clostridium magnum TaxID=33954 RepID=UPI0009100C83|nr:hypothetical protein [Clostridium magnum]SHJ13404.1 hypothetical protein SAMN02745944_05414 [Clostridium magnum DSM 2767]